MINLTFEDFFSYIEKNKYQGQKKLINLGQGNPKVEVPEEVKQKFSEYLFENENHQYPNNKEIDLLKGHVRDTYINKFLTKVQKNNIGIFNGATKILYLLFNSILDCNSNVLLIDPSYPDYEKILTTITNNIIKLPTYNALPDIDKIEKLIKKNKIDMIIFNYPNNPTGQISNHDFWKKISSISNKFNVYIVNDYTYSDYVFDGFSSPSLLKHFHTNKKLIEIFSFSKNYTIPGWRIASVIANKSIINDMTEKNNLMEIGIFNPIVKSLNYIFDNYKDSFVDSNFYNKNMIYLKNKLSMYEDWKIDTPQSGMFLWVYIGNKSSWEYFLYLLNQKNIIILPGVLYGPSYNNYIRISLNTNYAEIDELIKRLEE